MGIGRSRARRGIGLAATACVVVLTWVSPAGASWSLAGSGAAEARALVMPTGATPTPSASGNLVTVSWTAATFADGAPVAGYTVSRYSAAGVLQPIGSGCSGVVTTTSCTELAVPAGNWTYTDTPVQDHWTGTESAQSAPVQVTS